MNTIGVVILVRFNSSRLPGKALIEIDGKPILKYIIERVNVVIPLKNIVIATSSELSDDGIATFAKKNNVNCYRGDLYNVANRFYFAANSMNFDYAIRINGDNLFLDVDLLREMVAFTRVNNYKFISNVKNRTYPKGMSIEILELDYFAKYLTEIVKEKKYYEHVTLFLYGLISKEHYFFYNLKFPEASGIQLALDTIDDLERSKFLISKFESHLEINLTKIIEILNIKS